MTVEKLKTILLADDDADDRMLFEEAYRDRNDIVLLPPVVNGREVIDRLEEIPHDNDLPDLIILDHNMPQMNGQQTLAFLKANDRYSNIPVCICSTYADHQLTVDCMKLGAFKVSSKPITNNQYQKMMNDFLSVFAKMPAR